MPQYLAEGTILELRTFGTKKGFTMRVTKAYPPLASPASFQTGPASIRDGKTKASYQALKVGEAVEVAYFQFPASNPRTATQVVVTTPSATK